MNAKAPASTCGAVQRCALEIVPQVEVATSLEQKQSARGGCCHVYEVAVAASANTRETIQIDLKHAQERDPTAQCMNLHETSNAVRPRESTASTSAPASSSTATQATLQLAHAW